MNPPPTSVGIPPIVAQEVGMLHLQLAVANQRIAELQARVDQLEAREASESEVTAS